MKLARNVFSFILGLIVGIPLLVQASISLTSNAAGISTGTIITGGTANRFVITDATGAIQTPAQLVSDISGVGNSVLTFSRTFGSTSSVNALRVIGTSATGGAETRGVDFEITSGDSNTGPHSALYVALNAAAAGNGPTYAAQFIQTNPQGGSGIAWALNATTSINTGSKFYGGITANAGSQNAAGTLNVAGYFGGGTGGSGTSTRNIGIMGEANSATNRVGGYFILSGAADYNTFTGTAALIVSNGTVAGNIAEFRDVDTTVVTIADGGAASFTVNATFNGGLTVPSGQGFILSSQANFGYIGVNTVLTPDASILATGTTSNSYHIYENGDAGFDFNNGPCLTAACTDPTLVIHSHNQSVAEFLALWHNATNPVLGTTNAATNTIQTGLDLDLTSTGTAASGFGNRFRLLLESSTTNSQLVYSLAGVWSDGTHASRTSYLTEQTVQNAATLTRSGAYIYKALTNNTTTTFANLTDASNSAGGVIIEYGVQVFDATNVQYEVGMISCGINNKGGAFTQNTCTKFGNTQGVTSGTLTVTISITGANPALIQVNANSSLTPSAGYPKFTSTIRNYATQDMAVAQ